MSILSTGFGTMEKSRFRAESFQNTTTLYLGKGAQNTQRSDDESGLPFLPSRRVWT